MQKHFQENFIILLIDKRFETKCIIVTIVVVNGLLFSFVALILYYFDKYINYNIIQSIQI